VESAKNAEIKIKDRAKNIFTAEHAENAEANIKLGLKPKKSKAQTAKKINF
jgi:hypothetical protein